MVSVSPAFKVKPVCSGLLNERDHPVVVFMTEGFVIGPVSVSIGRISTLPPLLTDSTEKFDPPPNDSGNVAGKVSPPSGTGSPIVAAWNDPYRRGSVACIRIVILASVATEQPKS